MCRVLKVSRNGYYHWLRYGERRKDPLLEQLTGSIFHDAQQTYGTQRISKVLQRRYGWMVSRRRIAKTMKAPWVASKDETAVQDRYDRFKP